MQHSNFKEYRMHWKMGDVHKCGPCSSSKCDQAGVKYLLHLNTELQVNSILASERTVTKKKSKKGDFLEHQSILQEALAANPCDARNANGKQVRLWLHDPSHVSQGLLETLASCKERIEGCGFPLTESSSGGENILEEITGCKAAAENLIAGHPPPWTRRLSDCFFYFRVEKLCKARSRIWAMPVLAGDERV